MNADPFVCFRFSSNALPPTERVQFYREFVGRVLARADLEPIGEHFFCDARLWQLPPTAIRTYVAISDARR